jgi:hypothetical protein
LLVHSYECQGIQTKNPFDKILHSDFDLKHLKITPIASKGINSTKDYQKDSYNNKKLMGEKIKG